MIRPSACARSLTAALLATTALSPPASAQNLPAGYSTAYGSVGFKRSSGTLTIDQSSQNAIVNFNSFSIGRRNQVDIRQPNASSTMLDRVTGAAPSTIAGRLDANGQVYLINPNGIAITKTGVVKVGGGFVGSTLDMTDDEFLHARKHLAGKGGSAAVTNAGTITIGRGGYAALIGGTVTNSGLISVPLGKVGLGSGEAATLDVSGDGFLQVAVPTAAGGKGALIQQSGTISAAGGTVVLDAATARAAARAAVNISGDIDAHTISGHSGAILIGGGDGGAVAVSGKLDVASRHTMGGAVTITGQTIALSGARIKAAGRSGGGTVKIGGDLHGGGALLHAGTVTIDAKSVITADATGKGDGGNVVVWSDETTSFAGVISAKGGAQGGDGGTVEVSSHGALAYTGLTTLTAAHGAAGTLLLDPYDVVISNGADSNQSGLTAIGNDSVINVTTLQNALAFASVTVSTGSSGSQAGNITVAAPVSWTAPNTLTLSAANAIAVDASITVAGGGKLALNTATATVGSTIQPLLSFASGGSVTFASGQTGQALAINGAGYKLEYSLASLASDANATPSGTYALVTSVDGSNGGSGYGAAPITRFTGTFEGLGNMVNNLTISASGTNTGLIGQNSGTIRDIGIVGGSVTGNNNVGGLVGTNASGTIIQAYATGTVSGQAKVGDLAGVNNGGGTITQSYATGTVGSGNMADSIGGLVGLNYATITQSYATGAVNAANSLQYVGGLVGYNAGSIGQSYATGAVVGGRSSVGGLVGFNYGNAGGTVTSSYYDTQTTGQTTDGGGATGVTTAMLAGAPVLVALNSNGTAWGNAGNKTTPYLLNNIGPVFLATDTATAPTAPTFYTPILTQAGLQAVNAKPSANYVLANNLDLTGATYYAAVIPNFSGTFDGLGHTISNLTIYGGGKYYVGLFGTLAIGGTVRDIGLVGGSVFGNSSVGDLVGVNEGTITRAYATGAVTASGDTEQYVGGLVGFNVGSITQAYATGAVSGSYAVGGLVGYNGNGQGNITQAYATGAVTGVGSAEQVGGLVGFSYNGTITQAYATGAVSGLQSVGAFVGESQSNTITQAYYDTLTAGPSSLPAIGSNTGNRSVSVAGLTTRQLQGLDPLSSGTITDSNHLGSTFGGGTGGLYPYLSTFFPNGVQAISGYAYTNAGTTAASGATIGVIAGGKSFGTASAGANGYYYAFAPAGTAPNDASGASTLLAYGTSPSSATVTSVAGTTVSGAGSSTLQTGVNLYGNTLAGTVGDTLLSTASTSIVTNANAAANGNAGALAAISATTGRDYIATGASFTIDQPVSTSGVFGVQTTTANAPITVLAGDAITIGSGGGLILNAAGALTINAPVVAKGNVAVNLAYDQNATTPSPTDFGFGPGAALTYSSSTGATLGSGAGGSLAINGTPYTLEYSLASLASDANAGPGAYALATNLDGSNGGNGYTSAPITTTYANANGIFYGTLEGLGHTVSNLTIAGGISVGLVGVLGSDSTIRDIGIVGGRVSGTANVGALVGQNQGSIVDAYASTAVSGVQSVGGLVGGNNQGSIIQSYATGKVTSSMRGNMSEGAIGGLVGSNGYNGVITLSYATGSVTADSNGYVVGGLVGGNSSHGTITQSYATGAVAGSYEIGGLVGDNSGQISNVYATGTVTDSQGQSGGLVGQNESSGSIIQAYASGALLGSQFGGEGGLVGYNYGSITQAYATGAVTSTGPSVGGLVGVNGNGGTITQTYATGAVIDNSYQIGGLVGNDSRGSVTYSAYDSSTTGAARAIVADPNGDAANVAMLTTAQLQSTATANPFGSASGFTGGAAGGQNGLYPYLSSFFPNGVQAISGFAYKDGGATASAGVTVGLIANGASFANASVGANGYFYSFAPAGTAANGTSNLLAYGTTTSSAFVTNVAGTPVSGGGNSTLQTGLTLYGNTLSGTVSDTLLSTATASLETAANTAANGNAGALAAISTATGRDYIATGSSFTIDRTVSTNSLFGVQTTTANAPITAAAGDSITIGNGGALILDAAGALTVNAPITAKGTVSVALAYDQNTSTGSVTDLSFAEGAPLTFVNAEGIAASSSAGGTLAINGTAYTLEYSLAGLASDAGSNPSGAYALATSVDGSNGGVGYNQAPISVGGNSGFSGTLEGLGNIVTNLTVNNGQHGSNAGLISVSSGTVRDIGVVGGSVRAQYSDAGALVAYALPGSLIVNAYATASVSAGDTAGGLVGANGKYDSNSNPVGGTIINAYATGVVSGHNSGGLVGNNFGTITNAYSTGAVRGGFSGGLIGNNFGSLANVYATGAVSGGNNGGLIGTNFASGITNAYWDMSTAGSSLPGIGTDAYHQSVTGLTTSAFQTAGASANLGAAFAGGGGLYPYLASFFPNGVEAVSGTVNAGFGSGVATGATVTVISGGTTLGSGSAGATGYYYAFGPAGTIANNAGLLAYTTASTGGTNAARLVTSTYAGANTIQTGVDLYEGVPLLYATTGAATLSASGYNPGSTPALPFNAPSFLAGAIPTLVATNSAGFTIDQTVDLSTSFGVATVASGAPIIVANPITIENGGALGLLSAGALTVNAPITAKGAAAVVLAYDQNTTTPSLADLSFGLTAAGFTSSLTYTDASGGSLAGTTGAGGSLSINGTPLTLLYALASPNSTGPDTGTNDIAGIDNAGSAGRYALATNVDGMGTTFTSAPAGAGGNAFGNGNMFTGTFEGLGHVVSNLTIVDASSDNVGLFGSSSGTIRDVGVVGGSVTSAGGYKGDLVGYELGSQNGTATIIDAYATGNVTDTITTGGSGPSGGLVGFAFANSSSVQIQNAYATGAVSGGYAAGGLVGLSYGTTLTNVYATGAVTSGVANPYVGGLVGVQSGGAITDAYATGTVSSSGGGSYVAGLVGSLRSYSGATPTITDAYATGAVSASGQNPTLGGLVADLQAGTITSGYYDSQTTGQSDSNGTGLTTAALQGGQASLDAAFAGGSGGLYPYLSSFFPNGVQAISGFAYNDGGATPATGSTVNVIAGGHGLGGASVGANGYYYVVVPGANSISSGANLVAYTSADATTGSANAVALATTTGAANQQNIYIYGNAITVPTTATSLTSYLGGNTFAQAQTAAQSAAITAEDGSTAATSAINGASGIGLITSGASFTVDAPVSTSGTFVVQTGAGAPITVAAGNPITLGSGGSLGLLSGGTLTVNAPITAQGAATVAFGYDASAPTNLTFAPGVTLSFANADGRVATRPVQGQALAVNGQGYTLVYNMAELDAIDGVSAVDGSSLTTYGSGLTGNYALAGNVDASASIGTPYTTGVIAGGGLAGNTGAPSPFSGTFEGLGHTVSNLTIDGAGDHYVGLIGYSTGTVRDIGVVGGSISGTYQVGGLVGENDGLIAQAYATGTVSGASQVGGLVGYNDRPVFGAGANSGIITQAYATGVVSGDYAGGLVGQNDGSITQAYATGAVSGGYVEGGFAGYNNGSVTQAYSTGAVASRLDDHFRTMLGGFAGSNFGTITQAYATGVVLGGGGSAPQYLGGLVGYNAGTVTKGYYDTLTTGPSTLPAVGTGSASGITGYTTRQLQGLDPLDAGTIADATHLGSAFAGGTGGLYPYLSSFFPSGVQATSGFAYTDAGITPAAGATVGVIAGGQSFASASAGANGYYYAFAPAGTAANDASGAATLLAYSTTPNSATLTSVADTAVMGAGGSTLQTGVTLYGNAVTVPTMATSLSSLGGFAGAVQAARMTAEAADDPAHDALAAISGAAGVGLVASGSSFTVDAPVTTSGTFLVQTTASGAPITVVAGNSITIGSGGALGLYAAGALAIDADISVPGAGSVALAFDRNTTTASPADLAFALGSSLSFTGTDGNGNPLGTLAINGQGYTLINALVASGSTGPDSGTNHVAGIDNAGDGGHYALAVNLDGTGTPFTASLFGAGGNTFAGTFEGLGHTITNLAIASSETNVGLVGQTSGTVRDIGLLGGSVSGTSDSGNNANNEVFVGALAGLNTGTIAQAYATTAVDAVANNSAVAGGLVGHNAGGTITQAYATGPVTASISQFGTFQYFAYAGGLVGSNDAAGGTATITNAYATGAVSAIVPADRFNAAVAYAGGLVGSNNGSTGTAAIITNAYATGVVSAAAASRGTGGLVGTSNGGTVTYSYYDTTTTGQGGDTAGASAAVSGGINGYDPTTGSIGLTTAQLQGTAPLSEGSSFSLVSAFMGSTTPLQNDAAGWGGGANGLYPYLNSFFPNGVQAIAGTAQTATGTPVVAGQVAAYSGGTLLAGSTASTGANGYFYEIVPAGTLTTSGVKIGATVTPSAATSPTGLVYTDAGAVSGSVLTLPALTDGGVAETTARTTYSALQGDLGTTFGTGTLVGLQTMIGATPAQITATGTSFTVDQAITRTADLGLTASGTNAALAIAADVDVGSANTLQLSSTAGGSINQTAGAITAGTLRAAAGTSVSLTGAGNAVGTLASLSSGGNVAFTDSTGFSVAPGMGDSIASTSGGVTLVSTGGGITLANSTAISGGTVLLAANGAFTNNAGANAVSATNGFTIYTQDAANPTTALPTNAFGGLTGANYYNDAYTFSMGTFASAIPSGNHFVYAYAASLTPVLGGSASKVYDGSNLASIGSLSLSTAFTDANGISDTATLTFTGAAYASADAGTGLTVKANGIAFASNPNNYTLASNTASAAVGTITQRPLDGSATIAGLDKTYDGTTTAPGGSAALTGANNVVTGDTVDVTAASGTYASPSAGHQAVTLAGLTLDNANYAFGTLTVSGSGTLAQAPLTITATDQAKTYGQTASLGTTAFSERGLVSGDSIAGVTLASAGTAATANAGGYAINASNATGSGLGNYTITYRSGILTVNPLAVQLAGTQVYNGTTNVAGSALAVTNLVNGDSVTLGGTGTLAAKDVGSQALTSLAGLTLSSANYKITGGKGAVDVTPATLTYVADAASRTYGTANPSLSGSVTGFVGPDTLSTATTGDASFTTRATSASSIGRYAIEGSGLIATNDDYVFTQAVGNGTALTVSPASLTITAADQAKTYGQTASLGTTAFSERGLVSGDSIAGVTLASAGTAATANAGGYAINASNATGSGLGNYTITYRSGILTVNPLAVQLAGTQAYNGTTNVAGSALAVTNLVNGDSVTLGGTGTLAAKDVGSQALTSLAGLTLSSANYKITGGKGAVDVTPATLTYVADAASRTYGTANPALSGSVTGFVGPDTLGSATTGAAVFGTSTTAASNVGPYAITGSGLAAIGKDYVFAQAAGNAGALTVTPAPLTVSGSKTYDATTGFSAAQMSAVGAVNGEIITLVGGSGSAVSANAGSYAGSPLSGLTLAVAGGNKLASNYMLPGSGTLSITPAPITVTAASGSAIYGNVPVDPGLSATGLQGSQGSAVLTGLSSSFALTRTSDAGAYALTVQGQLTNANYQLMGTQGGVFTITPRSLVVTADNQLRAVDTANAPLLYTIGGLGLVNGDNLTGALATAATRSSPAGLYPITQGTLAASANYSLAFTAGTLDVQASPVTPSAVTSAAGLASTASRALTQVLGELADGTSVPIVTSRDDSVLGSQIVRALSDPRFDAIVICDDGLCTVFPTPKPIHTSSAEP